MSLDAVDDIAARQPSAADCCEESDTSSVLGPPSVSGVGGRGGLAYEVDSSCTSSCLSGRGSLNAQHLRWKGTFIDLVVEDDDDDDDIPQRASSEPDLSDRSGRDHSLLAFDGSYFDVDRSYVEDLSDKMSSIWSNGGKGGGTSTASDDDSLTARDMFDMRPERRCSSESWPATSSPNARELSSGSGNYCFQDRVEKPSWSVEPGAVAEASAAALADTGQPELHACGATLNRGELRSSIRTQVRKLNANLLQKRRSQALSVIEELPETVEETLLMSASNLFDEVQGKVDVVLDLIHEAPVAKTGHIERIERAVVQIEAIPNMVRGYFATNLAKAKKDVQARVSDVIQDLQTEGSDSLFVEELLKLPATVKEIAHEAIQAAVEEATAQAQHQCDIAFSRMPEDCREETQALHAAGADVVELMPCFTAAKKEKGILVGVFQPVEDAAALVQIEQDAGDVVTNQVVADVLLRVKVEGQQKEGNFEERRKEARSSLAAGLHGSPSTRIMSTKSLPRSTSGSGDRESNSTPQADPKVDGSETKKKPKVDTKAGKVKPDTKVGKVKANTKAANDVLVEVGGETGKVEKINCENATLRLNSKFETNLDSKPVACEPEDSEPKAELSTGENVDMTVEEDESQLVMNHGSVGHPELCPRPCLFFVAGECRNGQYCKFCHRPHPKRPPHLDKRHREMLKELPYDRCLEIVLPVLLDKVMTFAPSEKTEELVSALRCLPMPQAENESLKLVFLLRNMLQEPPIPKTPEPPPILSLADLEPSLARNERLLLVALKSLSVRLLLTSLHRASQSDETLRKAAIDALMTHLREYCLANDPKAVELPADVVLHYMQEK